MIAMREIEPADKDRLREWRNLPEVAKYMHTDDPISEDEHTRWFAKILEDDSSEYWIIELDAEPVGLANIEGIDRQNERCSWAFYLASPEVRGRGIGGFVEHFVLRHVFDELGMHKLCGEVLEFNEPVVKMHEGFGFEREGLLREHIRKGDERHNVVQIAMTRQTWLDKKEAIEERLRQKGVL